MELAPAALIAAASIGASYLFCVRPLRRGTHCGAAPADPEITRLRAEVTQLRADADDQHTPESA